jgi:cellulose synthase/poly-beta-1,6-N-acetylglucosamine synthase-like glycosyltransferase/peptidoglycan/xylan/chitin deacetylase (PgdA/CDA1 family)
MSIFLDTTRRRKIYFRTAVVIVSATLIFIVGFFFYNLIFGRSISSPPVKYADTIESYHYYYSGANKGKIALTFDDGPRPGTTLNIMETLKKNGVPGIFFFIGQEVLLQPDIVKKVSDSGFDIGDHSFTHREDIHDSPNRLALELRSTSYLITKITGTTPIYYRPPFLLGIGIDPTINPYIPIPKDMLWTLEDGFVPTGTDIDPKDWEATSKEEVVRNVGQALEEKPDGHILLLHEEPNTVLALQDIIDLLKARGYTLVSLKDLLTPPTQISLPQNLSLGATDASTDGQVSQLQWFLYKEGDLDPYLLSGTFSDDTRKALIAFQLRNKLINPNSIDPKRAGVADSATRTLIGSINLSPASSAGESASDQPSGAYKYMANVSSAIIFGYVNMVPAIRASLIWMTRAALALVVLRCLFILAVFIIGWLHKRRNGIIAPAVCEEFGASILVPAYNEQENIRGTIESLLRSAYGKKEIVVIDDGSTDNTSGVVQEVIDANPEAPIRLLRVKNGGKASALNHGIEVSTHEICIVIDADAVLDPYALHYFLPHFRDPAVGAVAGRVNTTSNRGFLNLFQSLEYAMGQNIDKRAFSVLGCVGVVPGPAGAWRKECLIKAGGFSTETLVEDQDMTLTIMRQGKRIVYEERAISYTETPDTVKNFLKQRFRWIYGTIQCFWKNKGVFIEQPASWMSVIVMPNIFIFNILLPLTYPFADLALLIGLIFGEWHTMVLPFLLFSCVDIAYAAIGVWEEEETAKLLSGVPLQRVSYRQLIYYTVVKSVVRAIEGTGSGWNKFQKTGETQRFYFSNIQQPANPSDAPAVTSEWLEEPIIAPSQFRNEVEASNNTV